MIESESGKFGFKPIDEVDPLPPQDTPRDPEDDIATVVKPTSAQEPWIEEKKIKTFDSLMADISEKIDQGLDEPEKIIETLDDLETNYAEEFDKHPEYIFSKEKNRNILRERCEIIIKKKNSSKKIA